MMSELVSSSNDLALNVPVFDEYEELEFANSELKTYMSSEDVELYEKFVTSGFDVNNYKISPFYSEKRGMDTDALFHAGGVRWKRAVTEVWYYSLSLNHLLASLKDDFGEKDGEKEFYRMAQAQTGLKKQAIQSVMRVSQVFPLKKCVELQAAGVPITAVRRLAAPETPASAVEVVLEEARENGGITAEAANDIIDWSKNGESSDFEIDVQSEEIDTNNQMTIFDALSEQDSQDKSSEVFEVVSDVQDNNDSAENEYFEVTEKNIRDAERIEKLKQEKAELQKQLDELKHQSIKPEISIPEGAILIPAKEAEVFKKWFHYWANKNKPNTPRGDSVLFALWELKEIVAEVREVEIPESKAYNNKKAQQQK